MLDPSLYRRRHTILDFSCQVRLSGLAVLIGSFCMLMLKHRVSCFSDNNSDALNAVVELLSIVFGN